MCLYQYLSDSITLCLKSLTYKCSCSAHIVGYIHTRACSCHHTHMSIGGGVFCLHPMCITIICNSMSSCRV